MSNELHGESGTLWAMSQSISVLGSSARRPTEYDGQTTLALRGCGFFERLRFSVISSATSLSISPPLISCTV